MRIHPLVLPVLVAFAAGMPGHAVGQDLYQSPAAWLDEGSKPFSLDALRARPTVLTMAYGACRRICSTSLRIMENLQALALQRGQALNFVVVGLDPAQDKPADWAAFRADRKLTGAHWHFLTGDEAATRAFAQRLGVNYWRYDDHVMHDFKIVLLSPSGQVLRTMDHFDQPLESLLPLSLPLSPP